MVVGILFLPGIIAQGICAGSDSAVQVEIFGAMLFTSGIGTITQVLFGGR